ncbi:hypothetical protein C9374_010029 [Naegleria lovaniensis]|uniref:Uncharacterized protein n=1 Tax=Naegleria lovaniensis TaxID=51637 RepID=A0AA88GGH4_NAELO|nr:uncharacterized protein C9374_010029 [Naegleria lovaniensis]KAG2375025.1 hypothetical protein C9374_010029 [Naegleria lovaniensis]
MSSMDGKSQSTRFNSKTPRKTSQHVALNTPRNTIHEPTTTMNEPLVSNPVVMITTTHPSTINSQSTRIGNNYVSKIALVDEEGKIVANLENDTLGVVTISNSCGHGQNIRRKSKSQSTRMNHSMAMQAMAVLLTSTETIPTCQQRVMKNTNQRLSVNMSNSVSSVKDKSEQDGPVSQFKQKIRRKSIAFTKKMRFFDSADSMEGDAFVEYA